jgi:hypothetical protein
MKKSSSAVSLALIGSALLLGGCAPSRRGTARDTRGGDGSPYHGHYYGGGYHYTPVRRPGVGGRWGAPGASPRGGFGSFGHAAGG